MIGRYQLYINMNQHIVRALKKILNKHTVGKAALKHMPEEKKIELSVTNLDSTYRNSITIDQETINFQFDFYTITFYISILSKFKNKYKMFIHDQGELHRHIDITGILIRDLTYIVLDYLFENKINVCDKNRTYDTEYEGHAYKKNKDKTMIHMKNVNKTSLLSLCTNSPVISISLYRHIVKINTAPREDILYTISHKNIVHEVDSWYIISVLVESKCIIEQIERMKIEKIDVYVTQNGKVKFEWTIKSNIKLSRTVNI